MLLRCPSGFSSGALLTGRGPSLPPPRVSRQTAAASGVACLPVWPRPPRTEAVGGRQPCWRSGHDPRIVGMQHSQNRLPHPVQQCASGPPPFFSSRNTRAYGTVSSKRTLACIPSFNWRMKSRRSTCTAELTLVAPVPGVGGLRK